MSKILNERAKTLRKQGLVPQIFVLVVSLMCESHPTMSLHLSVHSPCDGAWKISGSAGHAAADSAALGG